MELHLFPGDTYDLGLASMFSGLEGGYEERSIMYHACGGFGKQFNSINQQTMPLRVYSLILSPPILAQVEVNLGVGWHAVSP